ncbi:hypothetical protein D9M68_602360 [compost metagenome]
MRQRSRSIMPGWVRANVKARDARIDTRTVLSLTRHAHPGGRRSAINRQVRIRACNITDLRIYGFLQNLKTVLADFRIPVKAYIRFPTDS